MCQRIYIYFSTCGCQLFNALHECEDGPTSISCGSATYDKISIITKKGQECRYHRHISYLREGAPALPHHQTHAISSDNQFEDCEEQEETEEKTGDKRKKANERGGPDKKRFMGEIERKPVDKEGREEIHSKDGESIAGLHHDANAIEFLEEKMVRARLCDDFLKVVNSTLFDTSDEFVGSELEYVTVTDSESSAEESESGSGSEIEDGDENSDSYQHGSDGATPTPEDDIMNTASI
ncbi:uncharacterized protein CTRU02_209797 [Colletotrichum truncatum]|uniref:Uncharacterized protein n=1 Tax=Colletotrichum truncatum TaxID=5467 RepID=A0ACC3YTF4_COLTU